MSSPTPSFSRGMPVEIDHIDRELKKLWEFEHGAATRASLINLAVYCEGAVAMDQTTDLIAELTQSHACRAILIATEPDAPVKQVETWISAHCHLGGAGTAKQVCCEQITFLLEGDSRGLIPNLVFSHLDSDLPLYLWWRAKFSETLDAQLLKRVDRLIFDSQTCSSPKSGFHHSLAVIAEENPRLILCDLNWTRTLYLRQALAQMFDHPDNLAQLSKIESVTITHSPLFRCTALLMAGWLIAQLGWTVEKFEKDVFEFKSPEGRGTLKFVSLETEGVPISDCTLCIGTACFRINREPGSEFLHACTCTSNGCELNHLLPAGKTDIIHLLNEELMLGGKHQVYLKAVAATEQLWKLNFT
ncbi:MAG: glucose-6-phosphate dehydrogenase assembly protein OpcA [Verrucomicrobiota bacterium]